MTDIAVNVPKNAAVAAGILTVVLAVGTSYYLMGSDEGFKEISSKIQDNQPQKRYGIAAFRDEGKTKIFTTGFGGPNHVLQWEDGKLVDNTPEPLRDPENNAIGAAACDIDGDGQEEIYVLTTGGQFGGKKRVSDKLYDKQQGSWTDIYSDSGVPNRYSGRSVACTYTPQGYSFFVARYGGPMQLITYVDGELTDIAPRFNMDRTTGGRSVVNVPTNDGVDIFVGNERGPNYYYERENDSFTESAAELGVADPRQAARGAAAYDKGGDGDIDLAVANWEGPHRIYEKTPQGFTDSAPREFSDPTPSRNLITGDFNNDGNTELFINNIAYKAGAPNTYHSSNGSSMPVGDAKEPKGLGTGATRADINSDGTLELVLAHGEAGAQPLTMYKQPNSNPSIRVMPLWKTGAPARTATVSVNGSEKKYVVDGGSAYLNQMEPWAHIGGAEPPVNVTVRFPDNTVKTKQVTSREATIEYPE